MSVELLARLNPTTVKFDTGKGGTVELTAQDIAAALAFVPDGLGREILIAVGWPDGANHQRLMGEAVNLACAELNRQFDAATTAGIRYALAQWENNGKRRQIAAPRDVVTRWPRATAERLPEIVMACVDEISRPNKCDCCEGRGVVQQGELMVMCVECEGRGRTPVSDRKRAAKLKMDESTYRRCGWASIYKWMIGKLMDEYFMAERIYSESLRG